MFVSTAHAQAAGAGTGGGGGLEALLPLILIFVVFYFLLIRPQQKKMKEHKEMLASIRRGDKVVTGGGIHGTVTKVDEQKGEVMVEIAPDVKVKVSQALISTVLSKTAPVAGAANDDKPKQGGFLGGLLGGGAKKADEAPAADDSKDKGPSDDKTVTKE